MEMTEMEAEMREDDGGRGGEKVQVYSGGRTGRKTE